MDLPLKRIEGGGTVVTYPMPADAERVQMLFKTNGRPMRALVELWVGPIRKTHNLEINLEDGNETPYRACLKFKRGAAPVLKLSTLDPNLPLLAGVNVPSEAENKQIEAFTESVWEASEKVLVQGGTVEEGKKSGGGAVRSWPIPNDVEAVQIIVWSAAVGKKSTKALIEVLQGPNNRKQTYDFQVSGSHQPYHGVFETPGQDVMIRIRNKKWLEDGLTQVVVVPFKVGNSEDKSPFAQPWGA